MKGLRFSVKALAFRDVQGFRVSGSRFRVDIGLRTQELYVQVDGVLGLVSLVLEGLSDCGF